MKTTKYKFDKFLLKHDTAVGIALLIMTTLAVIGIIYLIGSML